MVANQTLHVESADEGLAGSAVVLGNTAGAIGQDAGLSFTSTQRNGNAGYIGANSTVIADGSAGAGLSNQASATGDTATAGTCCGATVGTTTQAVDAGVIVSANAYSQTGALTGQVTTDSTAVGSTQGWEAANGSISVASTQTQAGRVAADTGASIRGGADRGAYTATAISNDVTVQATASPVDLTASQTTDATGATHAAVGVSQLGGDAVISQATATGNNLTVAADGGAAGVYTYQENGAPVEARSDLTVDGWNAAASNAYGVGDSAVLVNAGVSTGIVADQSNTAPVTVAASFTGGSGGVANVSATAVGNAVAAYACSACGGVEGRTTQVSSGPVRATATLTGGAIGSASSAASAVGNTATFQARSGN